MRAGFLALFGTLSLVALAPFPAAGRTASSCAAGGSQTERANSVARIYVDRDNLLIACSKRTGHREQLGDLYSDQFHLLRLRGHYLAFAAEMCLDAAGEEGCSYGVQLVDVRSGRTLFAGAGDGDARRVIVTRSGGLAWSEDEGDATGAVYRRDGARQRRLDRADGLDPLSLRLEGSTLSWSSAGKRRTATLR